MDYPKKIQALLDKYWEAETTLEEEQELKAYFRLHPEVADPTASYFALIRKEAEVEAPVLPDNHQSRTSIVRPLWQRVLAIAASVAIVCTAGVLLYNLNSTGPANANTAANVHVVEDPEEAYEQARQALLLVAEKMQATQAEASKQIEKVEPYTSILK